MKDNREQSMNKAIDEAKEKVEAAINANNLTNKRQWLEASPEDSYGSPDYRVSIFVLEGSPCKGYILVDYAKGIVRPFDYNMKPLKKISAYPQRYF